MKKRLGHWFVLDPVVNSKNIAINHVFHKKICQKVKGQKDLARVIQSHAFTKDRIKNCCKGT